MGPWGLYNEFDEKYYQNKFRNEFPDHKNISLDTLIELVGAIVQVLHHFASEILKSEKIWLPLNGSLRVYNEFDEKYYHNKFRNEFPDHENIGIDTLIRFVGAILGVLCPFYRFRIMAEHNSPPGGRFRNFFIFYYLIWKDASIPFKWAHFEAPTHMLRFSRTPTQVPDWPNFMAAILDFSTRVTHFHLCQNFTPGGP